VLLRGLHLATPLRNVFKPTAGVAAALAAGGSAVGRKWIGVCVAGWVGSEWAWKVLGI